MTTWIFSYVAESLTPIDPTVVSTVVALQLALYTTALDALSLLWASVTLPLLPQSLLTVLPEPLASAAVATSTSVEITL